MAHIEAGVGEGWGGPGDVDGGMIFIAGWLHKRRCAIQRAVAARAAHYGRPGWIFLSLDDRGKNNYNAELCTTDRIGSWGLLRWLPVRHGVWR